MEVTDSAFFVLHHGGIWSVCRGRMAAYLDRPTYRRALYDAGRKFSSRADALLYAHDEVLENFAEHGVHEDEADFSGARESGDSLRWGAVA